MMHSGDVILAKIQFTDTYEIKTRPALILYSDYGNYIVAGITSNTSMEGIPLSVDDGAIKDSVIKLNYIFTISEIMIKKKLFRLSKKKREIVFSELTTIFSKLIS